MRWTWLDMDVMTVLFRSPGHTGHMPADAELDPVLDAIDSTMDFNQRIELAHQAQVILLQKMIIVPIQGDWTMFALKANIRDFHFDNTGNIIPSDIWFQK